MNNDRVTSVNDTLREQLLAAETGDGGGLRISRAADALGARYAILMAAQIAAYLLVVVYLYPQQNTWLSISATAAFVVGLVATCRWYARSRQASSPGWPRRYSIAFAVTAGLFGAGIALLDVTGNRDWWLWVPFAALTAVPLLVAAPRRRGQ
jgi:peptidoglycan/LPS O-acetylase OafA/YrhL